jgi:hypothetical protein
MSWNRPFSILIAVFAAAAGSSAPAGAQSAKGAPRDPGDPAAAVPPVRYESAFARYRPNAEVEVGPWRNANDNVGRIGGWRVYGREAVSDADAKARPEPSGSSGGVATKQERGHAHGEAR